MTTPRHADASQSDLAAFELAAQKSGAASRPRSELSISAPPPELSGGPIPSVYRTQLDAPLRVRARLPIALAVLIHLAILAAAFILPRLSSQPPLRKPIIAKLVTLGKPRDQKLLPRKEPPPSAPPPEAGMVAPQITPPKSAAPAPTPKPSPPRIKSPSRAQLMQRALAQATRGVEQERREEKPEDREGAETGSVDANAANAEEGDQYFAAVQAAILANYVLPSIISERDRISLQATVDAWIASDGTITKYLFEQRSGNHFFDDALELAIKRTKVPPPPRDRAAVIARDGVALVFKP